MKQGVELTGNIGTYVFLFFTTNLSAAAFGSFAIHLYKLFVENDP
jgi:hypothetical protein